MRTEQWLAILTGSGGFALLENGMESVEKRHKKRGNVIFLLSGHRLLRQGCSGARQRMLPRNSTNRPLPCKTSSDGVQPSIGWWVAIVGGNGRKMGKM
ncbi:MAG: hypothetical protein PUH24_03655 [Prevotellaceae bacterium]|nr:hypothetical protein [Prevotellaceae bacterium]